MNHGQRDIRVMSLPGRWFYLITVFFLTLSGFGQMPIFKRYYIADIPGLGWLAEFFITHYIHYLAAILFLALTAYTIIDYLLATRKSRHMTATGYLRSALLAGILISGIFLVIRIWTDPIFHPVLLFFWISVTWDLSWCFCLSVCTVLSIKNIGQLFDNRV